MINRFILAGMAMIVLALSGYAFKEHVKAENLAIDVKNRDDAIAAYEQLIKVVPFEALNTERKEKANDTITHIMRDSTIVSDGAYSL